MGEQKRGVSSNGIDGTSIKIISSSVRKGGMLQATTRLLLPCKGRAGRIVHFNGSESNLGPPKGPDRCLF